MVVITQTLQHQLDTIEHRLDGAIRVLDSFRPYVNECIEYILSDMATKADIARLEDKIDGLEARFDGLETRFDKLEAKVDQILNYLGQNPLQNHTKPSTINPN